VNISPWTPAAESTLREPLTICIQTVKANLFQSCKTVCLQSIGIDLTEKWFSAL
jgi:hypothetical protein